MQAPLSKRIWEAIAAPFDGWLMLFLGGIFVMSMLVLFSASNQSWHKIDNKLVYTVMALAIMWVMANARPQTVMNFAPPLYAAGVRRLNVSLDSLRDDCVHGITGSHCLQQVLDGLQAARDAGFASIKINMVPLAGVNEADIEPMVAYCIDNGLILRLIEAMPMGSTGQQTRGVDLQPVLARLQQRFGLRPTCKTLGGGPARYWESADGQFTLGLITPISQHFCATCNRVRLSVDGTLYMCLGQEERFELRPLLRAGCSDAELEAAIRAAIELKPEKHEFIEQPQRVVRFMSMTGG